MNKKLFILIFLVIGFGSCFHDLDDDISTISTIPTLPNLVNLGLTPNNVYPFFPDTATPLQSNYWFDTKSGDTLIVTRRDMVTFDSGDELRYTFLVKPNQWIVPLKVKRTSCVYTNPVPCHVVFEKDITVFKLQQYQEHIVLACQIETQNGNYSSPFPLIDKMWIDLSD